jgi:hypothetical protein
MMKSKEEILEDFGCPIIPFDENVTMYYPAIISAMDEYADQFTPKLTESMRLLRELAEIQNGPPLPTVKTEWTELMNQVWQFLDENEPNQ